MFKLIPQLNNLKSSPGATDRKDKYAHCAKVPNEYKSNSNSLDSPFSFQQAIIFFFPYPRHKEYLNRALNPSFCKQLKADSQQALPVEKSLQQRSTVWVATR